MAFLSGRGSGPPLNPRPSKAAPSGPAPAPASPRPAPLTHPHGAPAAGRQAVQMQYSESASRDRGTDHARPAGGMLLAAPRRAANS